MKIIFVVTITINFPLLIKILNIKSQNKEYFIFQINFFVKVKLICISVIRFQHTNSYFNNFEFNILVIRKKRSKFCSSCNVKGHYQLLSNQRL